VTDKVFPDRFMHIPELVRLGAQVHHDGPSAIINGVERLSGACVMASDLRASAALVLAAMAADGETVIRRIYHLDRGYQQFEERLNLLGADIRRVNDCPEHVPRSLRFTEPGPPLDCAPVSRTVEGRQVRIDAGSTLPEAPVVSRTPSRKRLPD